MIPTLIRQENGIGPYLNLSCYTHLLMTYEHLTSRGDNSPKWTGIEFAINQFTCYKTREGPSNPNSSSSSSLS